MKKRIILIGMPGCGKTTIGKILSNKLNLKFYDMDDYIQDITGKTIMQLFEKGEEYFRDIETQACRELIKKDNVLISTGGGVIKRRENIDTLRNDSVIIFLDRPVEKIIGDVDVSKRPLLKDGKEKVLVLYKERYDIYRESADKIVVNNSTIDDVINKIKKIVNS